MRWVISHLKTSIHPQWQGGLGKHGKEIIASIYIVFPYVCIHADKATKNKMLHDLH